MRREMRLPAAALARRLEMGDLGIRLLHPLVRPLSKKVVAEASPTEKAEYAANLVRAGAPREALELLDNPTLAQVPETDLYRAFALVGLWDYAASIVCLDRYLARTDIDPYQRLVALANLAAALVHERRHVEAIRRLDELESAARAKSFHLLLGHAIRLRAEMAITAKDKATAEKYLTLAEAHMREAGVWDNLFLRKWKAIRLIDDNPRLAAKELEAVREAALRARHWETVRSCDAYLALAERNETLLWNVYFGTPFHSFREKLVADFGGREVAPERHTRAVGKGRTCDVTGWAELTSDLVPGDARFRLLRVLASDAYRPFRPATLFQLIFPGEHFNPLSSPMRIRTLVLRLRQALAKAKLSLKVESDEWGYRLKANQPIEVSLLPLAESRSEGLADRAARLFGKAPFAVSDAVRKLGAPERTCLRALAEAVKEGRLLREGKGRAVKYRFP